MYVMICLSLCFLRYLNNKYHFSYYVSYMLCVTYVHDEYLVVLFLSICPTPLFNLNPQNVISFTFSQHLLCIHAFSDWAGISLCGSTSCRCARWTLCGSILFPFYFQKMIYDYIHLPNIYTDSFHFFDELNLPFDHVFFYFVWFATPPPMHRLPISHYHFEYPKDRRIESSVRQFVEDFIVRHSCHARKIVYPLLFVTLWKWNPPTIINIFDIQINSIIPFGA